MFRALIALSFVVAACGGGATTDDTLGTIGSTSTSRAISTTTTLPPEPAPLHEYVISVARMPTGWLLVDDMSGDIGLGDLEASLAEGIDSSAILGAYRSTFARSTTSEIGALARSGAELVVSIAIEMSDAEAAAGGVSTITTALRSSTVSSQTIRTPGTGVRLELTGGIFVMAWSIDEIVQVLIANGVPGTNIVNIVDIVPDVG